MGAKARRKKQDFHGNIFWVTMSDLFIGMFMIFATLFFAFCANTGQGASAEATQATQQVVEQVVEQLKQQNINAVKQMENAENAEQSEEIKELQQELKKVDIEIDPFTGMARISELELFKLNSAELTPSGKQFLSKFIPVYLDTIFSSNLRKYLTYIIIQGHTDSQLFRGVHSPQEQYMLNMNLSMNRAFNVANFIFYLSKNKPYYKDLAGIIRVEGASFSKTIKRPDGSEDYNRSRRVELRLVLKEQKFDILQQFFQGVSSKSGETAKATKDHEEFR